MNNEELKVFYGLSQLNKPIRFRGLSSLQLGASVLGSIVVFMVMSTSGLSLVGLFSLTGGWIILLKGPLKKLNQEHKKGTPNYVESFFMFSSTPKKIRDKEVIFNHLIKTEL